MADGKSKMKILGVWLLDYLTRSYELLPQEHINDDKLLDIVNMWKPDLAYFVTHKAGGVRPETYKYISDNTSTTTVIVRGDDEKEYDIAEPWSSLNMCPNFNYIHTTCKAAVSWYARDGFKNVVYGQYGGNPKYCHKIKSLKHDIPVAFCGSIKAIRIAFLNHLAYRGVKIQVYGHGWSEGRNPDERMLLPHEYINIDFAQESTKYKKKGMQIKGRAFEVTLCGGFLLTDYYEPLAEFFKFGEEIETFKTWDECVDKIFYYLKHEDAREKIALAGYKRSLKDHIYTKRFSKLLRQFKLKK